jgi:LysM repeat protein
MENPESNLKPQPTGGLKLMTVFIAVLALHVIVIGGFTVYHLLSAAGGDQDLALDKNHKDAKVLSDGAVSGDLPTGDAGSTDKTVPASTPPVDTATTTPPATPAAPVTDTTPAPAPVADAETVPAASATAPTPSGPIQHGPVISPPESLAPSAPVADSSSMAASPSTPDAAPATDGTPYVVKKGDSLAKIARLHHVSLAKLKASNSLSSDLLHIGQKMVIPDRTMTASAPASTTPAPEMDNMTAPADVTMPAPRPSHTMAKTTSGHHLYTVVKGDTLIKIARRFKTTPTAIMTANNMTDAARLSIGKKLRIPAGEMRSAAASAPISTPSEQPETKPGPKGQLANFVQ